MKSSVIGRLSTLRPQFPKIPKKGSACSKQVRHQHGKKKLRREKVEGSLRSAGTCKTEKDNRSSHNIPVGERKTWSCENPTGNSGSATPRAKATRTTDVLHVTSP